jgi:regulator of replication initiation timing
MRKVNVYFAEPGMRVSCRVDDPFNPYDLAVLSAAKVRELYSVDAPILDNPSEIRVFDNQDDIVNRGTDDFMTALVTPVDANPVLESMSARFAAMDAKMDALTSETKSLREESKSLREESKSLREESGSLRKELESKEKQAANEKKQRKEQKDKVKKSQASADAKLRGELSAAKAEIVVLRDDIRKMERAHASEVKDLQSAIGDVRETVDDFINVQYTMSDADGMLHIKRRDIVDRAQAKLAIRLDLPFSDPITPSLAFRRALGDRDADRLGRARALFTSRKVLPPGEPALRLLVDDSIRRRGNNVAHASSSPQKWYDAVADEDSGYADLVRLVYQ